MSRMRTHKKQFTIISNDTIQGCKLSLEGIGLLAICLSMPESWEFNPKQMWKQGYCGREKLYKIFNELIEAGHCIRIRYPNPKIKNLPGEISYEIFDDVLECEKRCLELQKEIVLIECSEKFKCSKKFKKCFRRPENKDPEIKDPESWDSYKETEKKETLYKETITMPAAPVVVSSVIEDEETEFKRMALDPYNFSVNIFSELMRLSLDQIEKGIKAYDQQAKTKKMSKGALITAIREGWTPNKNQKQIDTEKQLEKEDLLRINKSKCISLVRENELKFTDEYKMIINEYYIAIKGEKAYDHISYLDLKCIEIVEDFIKDYLN
jgi:hypothetical protein